MTALHEHARSMLAYTIWADDRLLAAADGIDDGQYALIAEQLTHMLATQRYWYANWTGGDLVEPKLDSLPAACQGYAASHEALRAFADRLTDGEWQRTEAWWKQWGVDATLSLGETITQVFYHGVQHRSEIAVVLSRAGRSPGDLDYLVFLGMP
ncbi:MAG: DinB family protein [Chloroflexi bacterium]|nr:DinB family protein [Chloroflexota bacterium]